MKRHADTRMMLHVKDTVAEGHECVMIRTVDTDVVVIAISCFKKIEQIKELWIAFGVGKILGTCQSTILPMLLDPRSHMAFYFSMHSRAVIRYHHLETRVKKEHGIHGQAIDQ